MTTKAKPGPKSRKTKVKTVAEDEIISPITEVAEFKPVAVVEVMASFNQRSQGRVVINPPDRMAPLKARVTDERWYFCNFCGRSYMDVVKYKEHLEEHENEEEETTEPSSAYDEQDAEDSEDEILINYKKKVSPSQETSTKTWRCTICHKKFASHANRREHMMKFHYQHTCDGCGLRFRKRFTLNQHFQRCHDSSNEFPCAHCPSKLATQRALQKHISMYHKKQDAKLKKSTKNTQAKVAKNMKMKTVTAGVLASRKGLLASSVRAKVVSKILYRCKICKKTFTKAFLLRDHHRLHTGTKPYSCSLCRQSFRDGKSLWSHRRSNHSNGPAQCPQCCCTFKTASGVTFHIRRIHNGDGVAQ